MQLNVPMIIGIGPKATVKAHAGARKCELAAQIHPGGAFAAQREFTGNRRARKFAVGDVQRGLALRSRKLRKRHRSSVGRE